MLKLGVIGTSWICRQFIDAALETGKYELKAVYSRSIQKGQEFVADFSDVQIFDGLTEFVNNIEIDLVYIASPNSLHYQQAKAAIEAGKNVIVEKPAFSNPTEFEEIFELAAKKKLFVLEAARHIHDTAFAVIKSFLSDKTILSANLTYAKYSSKMAALLAGELPNKWNPKFSGGILADLGVYLIYWTIAQFGKAESVDYQAKLLSSGVDVSGHGILHYEDFDVSFFNAGNLTSYLASEIYTDEGTLVLDSVAGTGKAAFVKINGETEEFEIQTAENPLFDEADAFADILENANQEKYAVLQALAQQVNQTLFSMRQKARIVFEADK
ncbi:MAG: Gfo/Idh/MocA family oxidoreductase [Streptococcaceae bacterium]|jgi:predicted dehydrogenase|nr:Gfo/Idh/MocA family oxidoreductase [Streptococcaceae bacterium]